MDDTEKQGSSLRDRAERYLELKDRAYEPENVEDIKRLLHELTVHQIELEMQNDELIRAQRLAEQARDQFRILFNFSPIGYLTLSTRGIILQHNQAFAELTGLSERELRGRTLAEYVDPRDRALFHFSLKSAQHHHSSYQFELRLLNRRGNGAFVRLSLRILTPLDPEDNNGPAVMVALTNITDIKEAHDKLKISDTVYKAIGEAIMVADASNQIIAINPAFTRLTGYTESDAIGKPTSMLKSGRHDSRFYSQMWQMLEKTGRWQGEIWNRRKSGEIYLEWLVISTVFDEQGTVLQRVAMFSDITEKKKAEQTIWQQANFDSLTGLPNRRMLRDRLEHELRRFQRSTLPLAILFIDLDHFKEVNDTLGHNTGDILLKEAASRLSQCVRQSDSVARLGGDEFTIVLSELEDVNAVSRIAHQLLLRIAEPFQLGPERVYISASIGVTIFPTDATEIDQLLKNADQAMYAAKQLGRNRVCYFTSSMQTAALNRMHLIADLRTAISRGEFQVHYQPIVELATGMTCKAEALLRWPHPARGLVPPSEFIPIAEETSLINEIGDWVFFQATDFVKRCQTILGRPIQISINKSPVQFREGGASHADWTDHLKKLGLDGHCITLEITEGLLLNAEPIVASKLMALRRAGIQVAIDDFGTGYSSLSYIKGFEIDYIKIDQSFVVNLASDQTARVLCEAIILMSHKLGMKVIAEGIETQTQCDILLAAGCDYGQGYLFSRAMPPDSMLAWLIARSVPLPGVAPLPNASLSEPEGPSPCA